MGGEGQGERGRRGELRRERERLGWAVDMGEVVGLSRHWGQEKRGASGKGVQGV